MTEELKQGDKVLRTDTFTGMTETLTYTGTRREVKEVLFDFFTNEKGETIFFLPSEVEQMTRLND